MTGRQLATIAAAVTAAAVATVGLAVWAVIDDLKREDDTYAYKQWLADLIQPTQASLNGARNHLHAMRNLLGDAGL